jgi:glucosamine--fructose-6-phosphate aminotransferase (isomerizing)
VARDASDESLLLECKPSRLGGNVCGLFGSVGEHSLASASIDVLIRHSQQRGRDSSGLITHDTSGYAAYRADFAITRLAKKTDLRTKNVFLGHSRLVTNGHADNQPVIRDDIYVLHNGIVVNHDRIWASLSQERRHLIDTEVIAAIVESRLDCGDDLAAVADHVLELCTGVVACAIVLPRLGKLVLFSNNGSLYLGENDGVHVFASESFPLTQIGCTDVRQVMASVVLDIPVSDAEIPLSEWSGRDLDLVPPLVLSGSEEKLLVHEEPELRRCTRCILPETMPYISFDADGVCNYCRHYKPRNKPRPKEELFELVEPYRRSEGNECIIPFSGGRDSCYGLHLVIHELKMRPVTYTYDWGMVTDLGRRNISRMCGELGVENIIVADDIRKKRDYIARNLRAWLKSPHLGMVSILTAGDKHFFAHVETMKKQTGIGLNLWGINPLEVTHFKAGFLGVPPDFEEERVYSHGAMKQLRYQYLRLRAMLESPGYFNRSLWDTLSGEYYRSFTEKSDYFHIFDYWRWDEREVEDALDLYDWERAPDTQATWRIGDGTAAFYNYVYYTAAGFSEHDTFRSNQIREGDLTRAEALDLVKIENQPRYANIKWYLDAVGMEFAPVIKTVNAMPRVYGR